MDTSPIHDRMVEMFFYNIEVCIRMMSLLGTNPCSGQSKIQLIVFLFNRFGSLLIAFIVITDLWYKERVVMSDIIETSTNMLLILQVSSSLSLFI